jgi:hypothetical protein
MKKLVYLLILISLLASCRSVKKITTDIRQQKDSVAYSNVTIVDLDTTIIPADTASLEAIFNFGDKGELSIDQVRQDPGNDITLNYAVEKTPSGSTRIKVTAKSKPKEVVTQNVTKEIKNSSVSSDVQKVESITKKKGISPWHLAWIVPVGLLLVVVYLKRKTILKYFSF